MKSNQVKIDIRKYLTRRGLFTRLKISEKMKSCESEIILGRSILDRALLDSLNGDKESYDWFDTSSEDFELICFISYLEPEDVYNKFLKIHSYSQQKGNT